MNIDSRLCQALCRDETGCLNKAKYNGYCSKHNGSVSEYGDSDDPGSLKLENQTHHNRGSSKV